MNDDPLEALLKAAAKSEAAVPRPRADLADRVRRLRRRRRRRSLAGGSLLAVILLGGVLMASLYMRSSSSTPEANTQIARDEDAAPAGGTLAAEEVRRLRAELARLDAEAEQRHRAARELICQQELRRQIARCRRSSSVLSLTELARISDEKTAFMILDYADRSAGVGGDTLRESEYRRIVECFPNTRAARTAKVRLQELSVEKGEL
jgi:hypothetical protein